MRLDPTDAKKEVRTTKPITTAPIVRVATAISLINLFSLFNSGCVSNWD